MLVRTFIAIALILPSPVHAERRRKNSVNTAVDRLIQFVNPGWVSVESGLEGEGAEGGDGSANGNFDPNGAGSGAGGAGGGSGSAGASNGSGAGSGSGSGGSGSGSGQGGSSSPALEQAQLGSDADGGSANVANEDIGILDGQATPLEGGPGLPAGGDRMNSPANGQAFDKMYAMCMFFDENVTTSEGNAVVKDMVDSAAACGVNLVMFPITVATNSYPRARDANDGASGVVGGYIQQACNIKEYLGITSGVSASICVDDEIMSDQSCKQTCLEPGNEPHCEGLTDEEKARTLLKNTAGCATVQSRVNEVGQYEGTFKARAQARGDDPDAAWTEWVRKKKEHNPNFSEAGNVGNNVAASIEDMRGANGCTGSIVNHEAIGHSMFGHPNGIGDGNSIGWEDPEDPNRDMSKTNGAPPMWTPDGCAAMLRNAIDNPGRKYKWDRNRSTYYTKSTAVFDISTGQGIMAPPLGIPAAGPVTAPPPLGPGGGRVSVVTQDLPPKNGGRGRTGGNPPSQNNGPGQPDGTDLAVVDPEGRHRKQLADKLLGSLDDALGTDVYKADGAPPESGSGKPVARITFNDGAKKKKPGESDGGNGGGGNLGPRLDKSGPNLYGNDFAEGRDTYAVDTGDRPPEGLGGGAGRVGFDDSRKKGAVGGGDGSNRRPSSVGGLAVGGGSAGGGATGGEGGAPEEGGDPNLAVGGPTGPGGGLSIDTFRPIESTLEGGFFEALGEEERQELERRRNSTWRRGGATEELRPRVEEEDDPL